MPLEHIEHILSAILSKFRGFSKVRKNGDLFFHIICDQRMSGVSGEDSSVASQQLEDAVQLVVVSQLNQGHGKDSEIYYLPSFMD